MSTIIYRQAVETDFPDLAEMYTRLNNSFYQYGYRLPQPEDVGEAWLTSFRRTLGRFSNLYVAESHSQLAGFTLCRIKRIPAHMGGVTVGELSDLWLEEHARRQGIARRLVNLAVEWMRGQGVHSIEVQVLRKNNASLALFEQLGFETEFRVLRLMWDKSDNQDA